MTMHRSYSTRDTPHHIVRATHCICRPPPIYRILCLEIYPPVARSLIIIIIIINDAEIRVTLL